MVWVPADYKIALIIVTIETGFWRWGGGGGGGEVGGSLEVQGISMKNRVRLIKKNKKKQSFLFYYCYDITIVCHLE